MAPRSVTENILKYKNKFWLAVALLIGFAFRAYRLDAQSLWNDEGTSIALASRSLEAITNGAAQDIHPPLYYFLLHYWLWVSGNSEFAVRFLSVIAGVLIVALTFKVARFFFDEEVANIAAFFSAFSPFQVYYSQETRMYIWVAAFSAVSVYAMTRMLEVRGWRLEIRDGDSKSAIPKARGPNSRSRRTLFWLLYIFATIATLYTHYFGATVVVFENLAFAVWLWLAWRANQSQSLHNAPLLRGAGGIKHTLFFWIVAQIICALAFLPWYLFTRERLASWPAISEPFDLPTLLWRVLNVFGAGLTHDASGSALVAFAFAILFFVGWRSDRNAQTIWGVSLIVLWALVPILAMYVVSLVRPAYNPKFLLLATPPFFILAARGLGHIHPGIFLHPLNPPPRSYLLRYFYFGIAVVAAVAFIPSLQNYYYDPSYARDDYRGIVQFIDMNSRTGDGILIDAPGQIDVVRYYHRGDQALFLLPRMRPLETNATRTDVDEMLAKTQRLFAVYYATAQSDPQGIIETRLAERAYKARDEWHGNVRLGIYGVAPSTRGAGQSADVRLGDEIKLESWQLGAQDAHAGDVLTLTLNWNALQTPSSRFKVFVHLLDANNRVVAQRDGEPVGDTRITTTWGVGENIADNYGLFIEPGTPPGEYQIEIGMYRVDNGARLPIAGADGKSKGDHLILGTVRIAQ